MSKRVVELSTDVGPRELSNKAAKRKDRAVDPVINVLEGTKR
jgi:hypothetical protein